jgi:adenylate cyclase
LPDYAQLSDVLKVIDVRQDASGQFLQILMNADQSEAMGYLAKEGEEIQLLESEDLSGLIKTKSQEEHWVWRLQAVETLATHLDPKRFGVKGLYLMGSTKNATAGPKSDIDLLVHIQGTDDSRRVLETWLEAWSLSLAELNFQRTGYRSDGLLDIHFITDDDIRNQTSYAVRIGSVNDPARPLKIGGAVKTKDLQ